jgi:rhamnose utilization protein RhaD (predicted bifunctional aldolase and dehydrogenase)
MPACRSFRAESMNSLWNDRDAARFPGALGPRVYTSRLLGGDPSLVLYGGGNTSVKLAGDGGEVLYVKGSGADLGLVSAEDFVPLHLTATRALLEEPGLDNREMMRRLDACLVRRPVPRPSIETLLHAALPFQYVEHTHADAVLALINTERGNEIAGEVYGELAPVVPYRHSGVELARACLEVFRARGTARTLGLVLQFHGAVAFGQSARESYENMLRIASLAEDYLKARNAWDLPRVAATGVADPVAIASLRQTVCRVAGMPLIARTVRDPLTLGFARRADLRQVSQVGPGTPQHAVFGRRVPLLGRDAEAFATAYRAYLDRHLGTAWRGVIDPAPRIALDPEIGLVALGVNAEFAGIAAELYRHDIEIISRACAHDRYASAPEAHMAQAELEYAGFEARLRAETATVKPLLGQVAVVAPEAARHEPGLVPRLLGQGAAVAGPPSAFGPLLGEPAALGYESAEPQRVAHETALAFGGADLLFATPSEASWRQAFAPLLARSPVQGGIEAVA